MQRAIDDLARSQPSNSPNPGDRDAELSAALRAIQGTLRAQSFMLTTFNELIPILAAEIDRLKHTQDLPPE